MTIYIYLHIFNSALIEHLRCAHCPVRQRHREKVQLRHRDLLPACQVLEVCDLRVGKVRDRTNSGGWEPVSLEESLVAIGVKVSHPLPRTAEE